MGFHVFFSSVLFFIAFLKFNFFFSVSRLSKKLQGSNWILAIAKLDPLPRITNLKKDKYLATGHKYNGVVVCCFLCLESVQIL